MSFLTILTLVSIPVPGIAKLMQAALLNFIYMDILQTDRWLIPLIFPVNKNQTTEEDELEEQPINSFFDENGFESRALIKNLGSTFIYLFVLIIATLQIPVLKVCKGKNIL